MFSKLINKLTTKIVKIASYADIITFNRMKLTSRLLNVLSSDSKFSVLCKFNWIRHFPSQPEILEGLSDQEKFTLIVLKRTKHGDMLFHYLARNGYFKALRNLYDSFLEPTNKSNFSLTFENCYKLVIPSLSNFEYKTTQDLLPESEKAYYKSEKKRLQPFTLSIEDIKFLKSILATVKVNRQFVLFGTDLNELFKDVKVQAKNNDLIAKPNLFVSFGDSRDNGYCLNESVILPLGKILFLMKKSEEICGLSVGRSLFNGNAVDLIQACLKSTIGHELGHMYFREQNTVRFIDKILNILHEKIYNNYELENGVFPKDMILCILGAIYSFAGKMLDGNDEISAADFLTSIGLVTLTVLSRICFQSIYSRMSQYEELEADKFSRNLSDESLKGQYSYFRFLTEKGKRQENDPFSSHPSHAQRAEIAGQQLIKKGYQLS